MAAVEAQTHQNGPKPNRYTGRNGNAILSTFGILHFSAMCTAVSVRERREPMAVILVVQAKKNGNMSHGQAFLALCLRHARQTTCPAVTRYLGKRWAFRFPLAVSSNHSSTAVLCPWRELLGVIIDKEEKGCLLSAILRPRSNDCDPCNAGQIRGCGPEHSPRK